MCSLPLNARTYTALKHNNPQHTNNDLKEDIDLLILLNDILYITMCPPKCRLHPLRNTLTLNSISRSIQK